MKFCKDCKWIKYGQEFIWCQSPNNGIEPIEGYINPVKCSHARRFGTLCGSEGKWFEEKPKKKFFFF